MGVEEVKERLKLEEKALGRTWHVQASCATGGEGLMEGLNWLAFQVKNKKNAPIIKPKQAVERQQPEPLESKATIANVVSSKDDPDSSSNKHISTGISDIESDIVKDEPKMNNDDTEKTDSKQLEAEPVINEVSQ